MQLVDDRFVPAAAHPVFVVPVDPVGIDDCTGAVDVLRIVARRGVGDRELVVDSVEVASAVCGLPGGQLEPAIRCAGKRPLP